MENKSSSAGGLGLPTILFIVFLILKLCNVIKWSWWWVTSPLWISAGLVIAVIVITLIVWCIKELASYISDKKEDSK